MRRLILFRHAKAERSQPGEADRARALVERGRKDAARMGAYMANHALAPDRVLVSPAVRTQETWKSASAAFRPAPGATTVDRLYEATEHSILAAIKDVPASAHTLLVIGHNPGLQELTVRLLLEGHAPSTLIHRAQHRFPTAAASVFLFDGEGRPNYDGLFYPERGG